MFIIHVYRSVHSNTFNNQGATLLTCPSHWPQILARTTIKGFRATATSIAAAGCSLGIQGDAAWPFWSEGYLTLLLRWIQDDTGFTCMYGDL